MGTVFNIIITNDKNDKENKTTFVKYNYMKLLFWVTVLIKKTL